jgi:hypothetical protein
VRQSWNILAADQMSEFRKLFGPNQFVADAVQSTKQRLGHRSNRRVPGATVSCAAQKRLDKFGLYMYIHVL